MSNEPAVDLKVLAQPYRESASGQTFITNALADEKVNEVLVLTAWVRESGMDLIIPALEGLHARKGVASMLFGVDLKGSSRQGVDAARRHFDELHVVHDPSRTFHPKMYLALGPRVGYVLIGSNNLTAGGLWHNYESAVMATFDPRTEPEIADGVRSYAQQILDDVDICRPLTNHLMRRLVAENFLADEAADRQHRKEDRAAEAGRRRKSGEGKPIFGTSKVAKRSRPAPVRPARAGRRVSSRSRRQLATGVDSWWKLLGRGDAQHPPSGNPTGNITLTDAPGDQDRDTFFRRVFFGPERWRRSYENGKMTEVATVRGRVQIGDDDLGDHELTAVYRPYRKARSRATTVLRWGEPLLAELRTRNVTGWYLLIERADVGGYRITVTEEQPT